MHLSLLTGLPVLVAYHNSLKIKYHSNLNLLEEVRRIIETGSGPLINIFTFVASVVIIRQSLTSFDTSRCEQTYMQLSVHCESSSTNIGLTPACQVSIVDTGQKL